MKDKININKTAPRFVGGVQLCLSGDFNAYQNKKAPSQRAPNIPIIANLIGESQSIFGDSTFCIKRLYVNLYKKDIEMWKVLWYIIDTERER